MHKKVPGKKDNRAQMEGGGQYFNDLELEIVHKPLFLPLQSELSLKGMLVIDGIDILRKYYMGMGLDNNRDTPDPQDP